MKRAAILVLLVLVLAGGMTFAYFYFSPKQQTEELRVFAAASLATPFQEIGAKFEEKYGTRVIFNFAGSNTLSAQIISGVPADVFASANVDEMVRVSNANLLAEGSTIFARNSLVILVSPSVAGKISSLSDLTKPGVRLVLADKNVPVGKYTADVLSKIDSTWGEVGQPGYQEFTNFSAKVYKNTISYEPDDSKVVGKVVNGVADAGLAYSSDSIVQGVQVKVIVIPKEVNIVAIYPIGVISTTKNSAWAKTFVDFILSEEGQTILTESGFLRALEA